MSTFSITTINGKRCTAVPKSTGNIGLGSAVSTSAATTAISVAAPPTVRTESTTSVNTAAPATTISSAPVAVSSPPPTSSAIVVIQTSTPIISTSFAEPPTTSTPSDIATTAIPITSSASIIVATTPIALSTPQVLPSVQAISSTPGIPSAPIRLTVPSIQATQSVQSTSSVIRSSQSFTTTSIVESAPSITPATVQPFSDSTSTFSAAPLPLQTAASQISTTLSTYTSDGIQPMPSPTGTTSNTLANDTVNSQPNIGGIVGGITGGIAVVAILAFLLWWYRRRERINNEYDSPPNSATHRYDETTRFGFLANSGMTDGDAEERRQLFPVALATISGPPAALLTSLRSKFVNKSSIPTVDMDRGNSQFFESVRQHSREPSSAIVTAPQGAFRAHAQSWWQQVKDYSCRTPHEEPNIFENMTYQQDFPHNRQSSDDTPFEAMQKLDALRHSDIGGTLHLDLHNEKAFAEMIMPGRQPTLPNLGNPDDEFQDAAEMTSDTFADGLHLAEESHAIRRPPNAVSQMRRPKLHSRMTSDVTQLTISEVSRPTSRAQKGRSDPFDLEASALSSIRTRMPSVETMPTTASGESLGPARKTRHTKQPSSEPSTYSNPSPFTGPTAYLLDAIAAFQADLSFRRNTARTTRFGDTFMRRTRPSGQVTSQIQQTLDVAGGDGPGPHVAPLKTAWKWNPGATKAT